MRGRTLGDAFVILDEAQNTTPGQMKMFLTRMGEGSRVVVTGDVTQIDLPPGMVSGLIHAARVLQGVRGVAFCDFDQGDIVRNPVVQRIVEAYERREE
jgi:phosphate starvation-inducible PhoH-like protein